MSFVRKAQPKSSSSQYYHLPKLTADEMDRIAEQTFVRYSSNTKRNGKGSSTVWLRNDLRVLGNEALNEAWLSSENVLPVYCVDPRLLGITFYFGFPKAGGNNVISAFQKLEVFTG